MPLVWEIGPFQHPAGRGFPDLTVSQSIIGRKMIWFSIEPDPIFDLAAILAHALWEILPLVCFKPTNMFDFCHCILQELSFASVAVSLTVRFSKQSQQLLVKTVRIRFSFRF